MTAGSILSLDEFSSKEDFVSHEILSKSGLEGLEGAFFVFGTLTAFSRFFLGVIWLIFLFLRSFVSVKRGAVTSSYLK